MLLDFVLLTYFGHTINLVTYEKPGLRETILKAESDGTSDS